MAYDEFNAFQAGAYDRGHKFSLKANLYRRPWWKQILWALGWICAPGLRRCGLLVIEK